MKLICYHYVQNYNKEYPNLHILSLEKFRKQLDFFEKNYYLPSKEEFLDYINNNKKLPENSIILTFDDGLKCHYTHVYKELKKRKLWGIFAVCSSPYLHKDLLKVHKIHLLLSKYNNDIILEQVLKLSSNKIKKFNKAYNSYKETSETKVKKLLNYELDDIIEQDLITDKIFNSYFSKYNYKNYYMTIDEIKKLYENGMLIANHTKNHDVLSNLTEKHQQLEIDDGYKFLTSLGIKEKIFCYPYGAEFSYNSDTLKILKNKKTLFALTTNTHNNFVDKLQIPRIDCNKF